MNYKVFTKKNIFILIAGLICSIALFCGGVFALALKQINLQFSMSSAPDIFCKIEVQKVASGASLDDDEWLMIFDNSTATMENLNDVTEGITRTWENGIMKLSGGIFDTITNDDNVYFRVTNKTTASANANALNASISTNSDFTTCYPSYGVQNIAQNLSKYFLINSQVLFDRADEPIAIYLYMSTLADEYGISFESSPQKVNGEDVCHIENLNPQEKSIEGLDYSAIIKTDNPNYVVQIESVKIGTISGTIFTELESLTPNTQYYYDYSNNKLTIIGTYITGANISGAIQINATTKPKYVELEIQTDADSTASYDGVQISASSSFYNNRLSSETSLQITIASASTINLYSVVDSVETPITISSYVISGSTTKTLTLPANLITTNLKITIT